jgi:pimeloyl-ACP methyl ester carboxylesterase
MLHRDCRFHVSERGSGPPVLFIQGTAVHGDAWLPQVDALADRYRCVWFDNRGMGRSQPFGLVDRLSLAHLAEDARAVLDERRIETAHVVGHSLGGLIALELALGHRRRVRSLALLCSFASGREATRMSLSMAWMGIRSRIGSRRARRRAFLEMIIPPAEHASVDLDELAARLAPVMGHDLADTPPIMMKQFSAMRAADVTARLGELQDLAALVVNAEHDPIARVAPGKTVAAGIPGARYVELAGASHAVPVTSPARVNALLGEFLDQQPK